MVRSSDHTHVEEINAATAFSNQAAIFDALYGNDTIIRYKRKRVRHLATSLLTPGASILELNAGTGEDAIYFAEKGYHVHATDISEKMQEVVAQKIKNRQLEHQITLEQCSFNALSTLKRTGPYDMVFSNFAGLNCTSDLGSALDALPLLVRPGGHAVLVLLPKFCLWEFLLLFKGKFKEAFRRFAGRAGAPAHIEGVQFRCWYYNPSFVRNHLSRWFVMIRCEGLCTIAPPSYMEGFANKHPRLYRTLVKWETRWKAAWPWRSIGDYCIISLRRREL